MWIVDRALARARKRSAPKKAPSRAGATLRTGPLDVRVTGRRCAPTRIASGNRRLDVLDPGARIPRSDDGICASFCLSNHMVRQYEYQPRIPARGTEVPAGPDWFHEIKHDGYRLIVQREGKRVRRLARNGHDGPDRDPLVIEPPQEPPNLIHPRWAG